MGHQIIKQPNELFCVWSTVVDDFIITDATEQELFEYYREKAVKAADEETKRILEAVKAGEACRVYCQFAMTYKQAIAMRNRLHPEQASKKRTRTG